MKLSQIVTSGTLVLSALIASANAMADDSFQIELGVEQSRLSTDLVDIDQTVLGGAYYFTPVSTATGPLAEAAFMSRSTNVFAVYQHASVDQNSVDWRQSVSQLGGTYRSTSNDLFVQGSMSHLNGSNDNLYELSVGWYVAKDWLVSLDLAHSDEADNTNIYGFSTKKLVTLDNGHMLNLEANYAHYDSDTLTGNDADNHYSIGGDYYLTNQLSIGAQVDWGSTELFKNSDQAYQVRAKWYFNDTMALNASYTNNTSNDDSVDLDTFTVGFNIRF